MDSIEISVGQVSGGFDHMQNWAQKGMNNM